MKTAKIPRRGIFQELNKCIEGESIEIKIKRIVDEKEPITDGAPIIFTEAKDGVRPEFNPRTDRWEIAIDAMDKVSNYQLSKYTQSLETPKKEEKQADYKETKETPKAPESN
uniref:Phage protein n=1 Tax=Dulem virus 214 TaxID=3145691 RepID=A0AAU8ATV3_9VIRU